MSGRGRVYSSIVYKPSVCLCCEVLCGFTAFVWNKYPCCCFQHPCVLPATKKIRTCNTGGLSLESGIQGTVCLFTVG